MDSIKQMLDTLTELSDEQVTELQSAIVGEFEAVEGESPTPQTVDAMTTLADMLDTVRGEVKRREAAAEELTARAAEATMRVTGGQDEEPMDGGETEEEEKAEEPEAPSEETPADETKKGNPMAEASTSTDENAQLSTGPEEPETETATEADATAEVEAGSEAANSEDPEEGAAVAEPAEEETVADAPVESDATAEASNETQETALVEEQKEQEAPVTAAADGAFEAPVDRRPVIQVTEAPTAITAGADIPGYTAGTQINDMSEVAELMSKRLHSLRNVNGGNGEQHIVASVTTSFPEERVLTQDAESNWAKIREVTSPEAITASGGHVAPFESRYDVFGLGTTARPVRDSLARFQADRGGIRFVTPPVLSSYANAVGVWTAANDSATTPSPSSKLSLTVAAAAEQTVATDAVTLQLQFGNLATRAYPELIARHNELGLIQHAREAEQNLVSKIGSASTAVTSTNLIGFGRDFLVQLGRASSAYRSRHRMEADAPLRAIVPSWVKDAMAADLALNMPGDSNLNAYAEIDGYVAARNVNLTVSLDTTVSGAQAEGAMNEFADTFTWYLFAEGSFLFLDGGTLDLGVIRDSTLVGTNDYKMFVETFENIAFVGVESLAITSTISVNGAAAALRDTTGGATAAVIEL